MRILRSSQLVKNDFVKTIFNVVHTRAKPAEQLSFSRAKSHHTCEESFTLEWREQKDTLIISEGKLLTLPNMCRKIRKEKERPIEMYDRAITNYGRLNIPFDYL